MLVILDVGVTPTTDIAPPGVIIGVATVVLGEVACVVGKPPSVISLNFRLE
jgi:hypothetical protein